MSTERMSTERMRQPDAASPPITRPHTKGQTMTMTTPDLDQLRAALLDLTPAQQIAAEALATGSTHADAAEAAGVARETVTRWAGHHPGFRSALTRYRHALAAEQADTARRVRARALAVVEAHLETADLADALAVLRAVDASPVGRVSTPEDIIAAEARVARETLPALPPLSLAEQTDDLLHPRPSDAYRAESLTVTRLASLSGLDPMETR